MEHTLEYAPIKLPGTSRRWPLATLAILLATGGAGAAVYSAADGAHDYLGTFGGCATGRVEAIFQLQIITPLTISLPTLGWWLAKQIGLGVRLCRCSLWAGIAAWATACVCAFT